MVQRDGALPAVDVAVAIHVLPLAYGRADVVQLHDLAYGAVDDDRRHRVAWEDGAREHAEWATELRCLAADRLKQ